MNPITPLGSGAGGPLPLEPTVFHLTNQAPKGLWERTWQKLLRDRVSLTCGIILLSIGIFCLLGPPVVHLGWGWTFDLQQVQLGASSPSLAHPFGTDILGRDLLVRCMHGGRVSLLLALLATVVSLGIGVTWGAVAGFTGGRLDAVLMRIVDLMLSMPYLLVVIVLMTIAPSGHVGLGPLDGRFLVMILALGLAMVLFLPVLSYQAHSVRGAASTGGGVDFSYATGWSLSLAEIPTFWWPTATGYGKLSYVGGMPFTDYPQYVGVPLLLLALVGFLHRRDRWAWMLLSLAFFSTLVALGRNGFLYHLLFEVLPGFNKFRVPVMILILQEYSLVLLAAVGMDALVARLGEKKLPVWLLPALVAPVLLAGGILLVLGTLGGGMLREESLRHWLSMRPGVPIEALNAAAILARHDAARLGGVLLAAVAAGIAFRRRGFPAWAVLAVWGGLVFVDLLAVDRPITHPERHLMAGARNSSGQVISAQASPVIRPRSVARGYVASNGALDFLARQESFCRVWPLGSFAQENVYGPQGIVSLGGYHAAKLRIYEDLRERLYPSRGMPDLELVKLLAARWAHLPNSLDTASLDALAEQGLSLEEAYRGEGGVVYRINGTGPRAWLVDSFQLEQPGKDTTGQEPPAGVLDGVLAKGANGLWKTAVLSALPDPPPAPGVEGSVEKVTESEQRILFRSSSTLPSLAVFADIFYPDWRVKVDGAGARLLRADYALRAVALPAGEHEIEFSYHDGAYQAGRWIQILSFLLILLGMGAVVYNRQRCTGS